MNLDQIVALVSAGFTKEEIMSFNKPQEAVPNTMPDQPQVDQKAVDIDIIEEPAKEEVHTDNSMAKQLEELKSMIQMQNRKSVQIETPQQPSLEDITRELMNM